MLNLEEFVSIILVNYKTCQDTIECLDSLEQSSYKNFEIIIVDNASSAETVNPLQDYINESNLLIKLVPQKENLGFARANNYALDYVEKKSKYIFILNNDTIVDKDCILNLVTYYDNSNNEKLFAITGKAYFYSNPKALWWAGKHPHNFLKNIETRDDSKKFLKIRRDIPFITGAFLFSMKDKFVQMKFDESFFFGAEDYELGYRAKKNNYTMDYVSNAVIWHKVGQTRSYSAWHIFNGYALKILLIKKTNSKFISSIKLFQMKLFYSMTLFLRYKQKNNVSLSYKEYKKLFRETFKIMKNKNNITEKDLNLAQTLIK